MNGFYMTATCQSEISEDRKLQNICRFQTSQPLNIQTETTIQKISPKTKGNGENLYIHAEFHLKLHKCLVFFLLDGTSLSLSLDAIETLFPTSYEIILFQQRNKSKKSINFTTQMVAGDWPKSVDFLNQSEVTAKIGSCLTLLSCLKISIYFTIIGLFL